MLEHWEWNSPGYQRQIATGQDFIGGFKCKCMIQIYEEIQGCTTEAPGCHRQRFQPLLKENREILLAPKVPVPRGVQRHTAWEILQI